MTKFLCRSRPALAVLVWLAAQSVAQGAIIEVPRDHHSLAAAVAAARPGDVIEVSPGTYPAVGLIMPAGVTLRGLGDDAADVVIDGGGHGRIMTCRHLTAPVVIQNLTFRGGSAHGESTNLRSGGALFIVNSEVIVQNCNFADNTAVSHGGAVRCVDSPSRFSQCLFEDNTAADGGGAIDVSYGSSPNFYQCIFRGNRAAWGGAISNRGSAEPDFAGCRFVANTATNELGFGGAVYADYTARPHFVGCTFQENRARYGGAIGAFQGSGITLENSTVVANDSGVDGAGLFCIGSSPHIVSSLIVDNAGAGIAVRDGGAPLVDCAGFFDNSGGHITGPLDSDSDGVLYSDPAFCVRTDAVGTRYHLAEDSPYVAAACGTLGAWTSGCGDESVPVENFTVSRTDSWLVVRWRADADPYNQHFRLTWTANGTEREIVFARGRDGGYNGVETLPAGTKADIRVRLYVRSETDRWLSVEDTGGDEQPEVPQATRLTAQAWPNPFNPQTTIGFNLPSRQQVRVTIHDLQGELVQILVNEILPAGPYEKPWNGRDRAGHVVAAGVYVVRVQGEEGDARLKVTLLK